jgi:hypothetical protein
MPGNDAMQNQVPCPKCGAPIYLTDPQCPSCGIELDEGRARGEPAPPLEMAPVPEAAVTSPGDRPWEIVLVVTAFEVTAVLGMLAMVIILVLGAAAGAADLGSRAGIAFLLGFVVLGGAAVVIGTLLWRGYSSARWLIIVLLSLQIIVVGLQATQLTSVLAPGLLLLIIPVVSLVALFTPNARAFCSR